MSVNHAILPTQISITVTESSQRLGEAIGNGIGVKGADVAEGIVVDCLGTERGKGGFDGVVGIDNDFAPGRHTVVLNSTTEVFGRDWSNVLGVNVCDEDVRSSCIDEGLDGRSDAFGDCLYKSCVLWIVVPEGIGVLAQIVLTDPDELHCISNVWFAARSVVGDLLDQRHRSSGGLGVSIVKSRTKITAAAAASESIVYQTAATKTEKIREVRDGNRSVCPCA